MKVGLKISLIFFILVLITGCTSSAEESSSQSPELMVFAAAQLQDAYTEAEEVFEEKYETNVMINFAGSQVVRTQIEQGAYADVFASADFSHMEALQDQNLVGKDTTFSHNTLTVLLPKSNPGNLSSLQDLSEVKHNLVIGIDAVPIGIYAREFLDNANAAFGSGYKEKVMSNVVSMETNTRAVAGKVTLGEADAGIVYVTDVIPSIEDKVITIEIPDNLNVLTNNTMAIVNDSKNKELAEQWIDFIMSEEGQNLLAKHKFMKVQNVQK
ncbi:molybdate ABC transporter substrate-binding protein [Alkalihalobacillus deserti]|uniref:molybdate ABC transporter substrate-binding protein n=1 Tax=Alkalihalobacillus deserti TaxID=2879466 RepID=UPI001D13E986|nr:molybdate ABC transporter substrate-binding protein [Alkalihalobacillus deserti]